MRARAIDLALERLERIAASRQQRDGTAGLGETPRKRGTVAGPATTATCFRSLMLWDIEHSGLVADRRLE